MNGPTHMAFGACSFAILAGPVSAHLGGPNVPELAVPLGLFIGSVAGLLPDIDEPNAMLARGSWLPYWLGPIIRPLLQLCLLPVRLLGYFIKGTLGHRGGTHSIAMSIIFTLFFAIGLTMAFGDSADWVILTIWFAYISHLIADSMTKSGCPWLWPLFGKRKVFHVLPGPLLTTTVQPPTAAESLAKLVVTLLTIFLIGVYFAIPFLTNLI